MSHAILECSYVQAPSVLAAPRRELLMPKFKNILGQSANKKAKSQLWGEEMMLMRIIKRITDKQLAQIHHQNACVIQNKFQKMKRKMRKSADDHTNENAIHNFFKVQDNIPGQALMKCLASQQSQKIDLTKKYQAKIAKNFATIEEVIKVQENKQKYRNWLNKSKNNAIKSPNFRRMSFFLERIRKCPQASAILKPSKQEKAGISRSKKESLPEQDIILIKRQSSLYVAQSKSKQFKCAPKMRLVS